MYIHVDHTDCLRHTAEMAVVEPIWQLHTLIVMNSWDVVCYANLLNLRKSSSFQRWQSGRQFQLSLNMRSLKFPQGNSSL